MTPVFVRLAAAGLAVGVGVPAVADGALPPEPGSYRTENYRATTPATLRGAKVVATTEAEALWKTGAAAFVDVLPHAPKPKDLPAGTYWHEKPRMDVPGSIWLPDTGYGEIAATTAQYFSRGLVRATNGERARTLVFYCLADCWMSWNAAKRALAMGYPNVAWYRDGTDGWAAAGLPLAEAKPERPEGE